MSDPITQNRLSMRLERYLSDYTTKNTDTLSQKSGTQYGMSLMLLV